MRDPRDKRFYEIQKKARTTMRNLTTEELRAYLLYTEQMIDFVFDKVSRKGWIESKKNITSLLNEARETENDTAAFNFKP